MVLQNIKVRCEKKHISIAELERRAELAPMTICKWENSMPAADKLARVAKVLRTTSEKLLQERVEE